MDFTTIKVQTPTGTQTFSMPAVTTAKYAAARVAEELCDPEEYHTLLSISGAGEQHILENDELIQSYNNYYLNLVHLHGNLNENRT